MAEDPTPEAVEAGEKALRLAGQATHDKVAHDYFAFDSTLRVPLPDGVSWVEHKVMNEGAKRKYLNNTNREVKVSRVSGDASISAAPGTERAELIKATLVGWQMTSGGQDVPFSKQMLDTFLEKSDPKVIDLIEKEVRLANPWLLAEMTVEDIDREIEALQELRAKKVEEDEGKGDSSK